MLNMIGTKAEILAALRASELDEVHVKCTDNDDKWGADYRFNRQGESLNHHNGRRVKLADRRRYCTPNYRVPAAAATFEVGGDYVCCGAKWITQITQPGGEGPLFFEQNRNRNPGAPVLNLGGQLYLSWEGAFSAGGGERSVEIMPGLHVLTNFLRPEPDELTRGAIRDGGQFANAAPRRMISYYQKLSENGLLSYFSSFTATGENTRPLNGTGDFDMRPREEGSPIHDFGLIAPHQIRQGYGPKAVEYGFRPLFCWRNQNSGARLVFMVRGNDWVSPF